MDENYGELFERIRAKCRQQHWYGSDLHNPFQIIKQLQLRQQKSREERERMRRGNPGRKGWFVYEGGHGTVYWRDSHGKHYAINAETDPESLPFQSDFEWPPATEEELADAEKWFGCPLPPLLRALYVNVANGGFGPGNGLEGVQSYALWRNFKEGVPYQKRERGVVFCSIFATGVTRWFPALIVRRGMSFLCVWGNAIVPMCSSCTPFHSTNGWNAGWKRGRTKLLNKKMRQEVLIYPMISILFLIIHLLIWIAKGNFIPVHL